MRIVPACPLGGLAAACALALAVPAMHSLQAALLPASSWALRQADGSPIPGANDNDRNTEALLPADHATSWCVVDLGSVHTLQRAFLASASASPTSAPARVAPATLNVRVGNRPRPHGPRVATRAFSALTGDVIRLEANLRFQPVTGRYLIFELERDRHDDRSWSVGEVEVYGWPGDRLARRRDAVVLENPEAPALRLAAEELSYYLGELGQGPVPIVSPRGARRYEGTLYRIVDLKPLAPSYEIMTNNMAAGLFPATPVNVERNGREISFRAWPYRNVLWSVWEFLERQGVRWVYPDAHGDLVPTGQGINPGVAPLQFTPSTDFIYANFGVEYLRDDPDAFLHFWRNRWSHTWGGHERDVFGGDEVPEPSRPARVPDPDHREGFEGYPHTLQNVLPDRILARHPDWCGMVTNPIWAAAIGASNLNRRLPPSRNWTTFDFTSAGARSFIIDKAIAGWPRHGPIYWLLPEDALHFSEDEASMRLREPLVRDELPYVMPYPYAVSGDYYDFICHIAEGIRTNLPEAKVGAMAYSNTHLPPPRSAPFPSNVLVEVCLYGARNLPIDAAPNAEMKQRLLEWRRLATHLRHYDYDLLHHEKRALAAPVPLVGAMASRARFFREHDMLAGGTQADLPSLPWNPWNYYAYPRFYWNARQTPEQVLRDFFHGYYREAGAPMLDYYRTLETHQARHEVAVPRRGYDYLPHQASYPIELLRQLQRHLDRAGKRADYWVTRERVRQAQAGFDALLADLGLSRDTIADR
jgi:hypothetical protein